MTVEINKDAADDDRDHDNDAKNVNDADDDKETFKTRRESVKKIQRPDSLPKPNFDEIVTEKSEEPLETRTEHRDRKSSNADSKDKGFSINRAWCCLRSRRTS